MRRPGLRLRREADRQDGGAGRATAIGRLGAAASVALLALQPLPARAADLFVMADQARRLCGESREWCLGFVTGALDGWAGLEAYYSGEKFCLPADLETGQIVELFVEELERRPEPRDEPATYVLYEHLIELFPCK